MSRPVRSAGLLPYQVRTDLEVLVAHPGGPFFAGRDHGSWSLVKGMVRTDESDEEAAAREFEEETGWPPPPNGWIPLGETVLRSRKVVVAWAIDQKFDLGSFNPGTFSLHGREYPEIDRVEWVGPKQARVLLSTAQAVFIDRLETYLDLNSTKELPT